MKNDLAQKISLSREDFVSDEEYQAWFVSLPSEPEIFQFSCQIQEIVQEIRLAKRKADELGVSIDESEYQRTLSDIRPPSMNRGSFSWLYNTLRSLLARIELDIELH